MKRVSVSVQNDYLERMSKTRPINAVAELVWNSLDADADKIKVKLFENEMGGLEKLTVTDNGHGLDYALAEHAFGSLGGSWKKKERKTRGKKRFLHGRQGKTLKKALNKNPAEGALPASGTLQENVDQLVHIFLDGSGACRKAIIQLNPS